MPLRYRMLTMNQLAVEYEGRFDIRNEVTQPFAPKLKIVVIYKIFYIMN